MIIYCVSIKIERALAEEWEHYMLDKHIPDVLNTGLFLGYRMLKLLSPSQQEDRIVYNIYYDMADKASYDKYQSEFAPPLQKEVIAKYGNKFSATRALYEVIK